MQSSTPSICDDSLKSFRWDFSKIDHETPSYGNSLENDSVSVQETSDFDIPQGHPVSKETSLCWSENMGFNNRIRPMNLGMGQNMSTSASDARRMQRAWGAFLPLAMDIIRCSAAAASSLPGDGFESDSNPGQRNRSRLLSGSDDKDDIHPASSPTGVGCQRTHNSLPSSSTRGASASVWTMPSPPRKSLRIDKGTHGSVSSRNRPAAKDQLDDIKLSLCRVRRERLNDLVCPVIGCQYKQLNGRMPDFRRHVRTHIPKDAEIRCKGVPWQEFIRRRHLFPKIQVDEQPYTVHDEDGLWIGGCLKTFSRADALKRHRRTTSCAGT